MGQAVSIRTALGGCKGYALLDSGGRRKLERWGDVVVERAETKAWWEPRLGAEAWGRAQAKYVEGEGWRARRSCPREWRVDCDGLPMLVRLSEGSRHLGVFPEQSPHWRTIEAAGKAGGGRLLNLFGYTGAASLKAAKAGWEVTHVDASKPALAWARDNQRLAGLEDRPIRWILEDAAKYVRREVRRGSRYEAVLLDPPAFGRAPDGAVWKMEWHLAELLALVREVLSERPRLVLLTAYNIEASSLMMHTMLGEAMRGLGGEIEAGELALPHAGAEDGRLLPLSIYAKWTA